MNGGAQFTNLIVVGVAALLASHLGSLGAEIKSPDGQVVLTFEVKDLDGAKACPVYAVSYAGRPVILPSRMGFELGSGPMREGFRIVKESSSSADTTWRPVCGERSSIRDHYNQLEVELQEGGTASRRLTLQLRAYDAGTAFCYRFLPSTDLDHLTITRELTEFRLSGDYPAWATYTAQGVYTNVPISRIRPGCERPLVIQVADDCCIALAEARCVDYARTKFAPLAGPPHSLVTDLGSEVTSTLPLQTPWRVVMVGRDPGQLLEHNDLLLNLNDPCTLADTSWIKPGKVIRETTLSTLGAKACIDFAAKHNLQYIEFDAGWYGPEGSDLSDARLVNVNTNRPQGGLDLAEAIRYGRERGIGVILYVNRRELERRLDDLLPLYRQWGVKGIKFGFVNVGSQKWTAWLHDAVRRAAAYGLMVDVHDEYRPTGWSRTYPNLMTQEGIRGDEERQPNHLNLVTVFTRMLAGAGDHTICYYDDRVDQQSSHAYQLAKMVCLYSPWQFLYWYDRPFISREVTGRGPGSANILGSEPELEFFDRCPTVWDDTRVLAGKIGEYAVIARRRGANWFVGAMNSETPRSLDAPLTFLPAGTNYVAHFYSDDASVPTRTHVRIERRFVDHTTVLKLSLPSRGGEAIRLVPATPADDFSRYRP